jgi:folate-binding protein YgfZ
MDTQVDSKAEHQKVRLACGLYPLTEWCLIRAHGKDVFSFLQSQTTNDVFQIDLGQGQNSAIVDRQARLIAPFSIHRTAEFDVLFLIESQLKENFLKQLESYHFREDIQFETLPHSLLTLQGPKSALIIQACTEAESLPEKANGVQTIHINGEPGTVINKSFTGEEGYVLACNPEQEAKIYQAFEGLSDESNTKISDETFDTLRIEAGIPFFDKDIDGKNILPETGLEHTSISYNKGCYIGQEVIARIKTYGAPNFALMGIILEEDELPPINSTIRLGDKKIGTIKSSTYSYSLEKNIALAYLHKEHRSPDIELTVTIADQPGKIKTSLLPFYQTQSRRDHSKRLLNKALKIFKDEENLDEPIKYLREAITLDPKHAAAYEALGVFLSRQDKIDEAIALMKRLVEIDPNEIMAHTNLSIYYMKQGRIEDAELEKGEATAIEFERLVSASMAKKKSEKEAENIGKEQERKIEMFEKVLEIDPVDQIANFGLGSIYLERGQAEKALPPLKIVVQENKDYSAAYLLLGKTWEKLENSKEAIQTYKDGIAAASKKGDLMPLKDMQSRLNQLLHS